METNCRRETREGTRSRSLHAYRGLQNIIPKCTTKESLPRGRTHGQVRSPQPQDACNLTQLRHALHSCPGLTPSCG